MDRAARSLMCLFGLKSRRGLDCHCGPSDVEKKVFADRKALGEKEWMSPCDFCAVGRCRYGAECQRDIRSMLTNGAYRNQSTCTNSRVMHAHQRIMHRQSRGATVLMTMLMMLTQLSQDARPRERCLCVRWHFSCLRIRRSASKVGGPCKVGIADVDRGGFGEAPMFWMLQIVDVSVPPGAVTVPQSRTDTTDFRFSQSKATGVPQKTQRCEARQQKLM